MIPHSASPSPSFLHARLTSLTIGDSERKSSSTQQKEQTADVFTEATGPGLVQRCVVVQKDQLGFGFTVCGERVKLVQNVRPGGAAVKAGVHEGDRIIKVNGSLVSSMSHHEVVKLIKSGTYVALTLQGPPPSAASLPLEPLPTDLPPNQRTSLGGEAPPPPPPPLPSGLGISPSQRITGPRPLQDPEVQKHASQILRKMLEQEEAELQVCKYKKEKNPSPSLEERIESAKRRAHQVRVKIQQDLVRPPPHICLLGCLLSNNTSDKNLSVFLFSKPGKPQIIGPEEEDEDGYAFNEMDGPFQDIELLKSRPAHMTVFMRYVFTQLLDPNPLVSPISPNTGFSRILLCFQNLLFEFFSINDLLSSPSEDIRGPLSELQQQVLPDIQDQIQDYRNKQMMGLGSLFGEGDLQHLDGDPSKEKQVVDRQIVMTGGRIFQNESSLSLSSSPTVSVRLARSESLKAQGEGRRRGGAAAGSESVPRSRSDVDMEDCGEEGEAAGLRPLQHSASSSASSSSARSLENPTPPYTPRSRNPHDDGRPQNSDVFPASERQNWQDTVPPQLLATLSPREVERQAVIYELFTTEVSHVRTLKVLDQVFFQKMQSVLNSEELACIFPNLHQVYELHASLCEAMKKRREASIVQEIGDVMLARFEGAAGDEFQEQASLLCGQQSQARELIKNKRRKDPRFAHIIQECEASPLCRRQQLKDLLVAEMQRLTKYPLLLDNILKHTEGERSGTASPDLPSLQRAQACCRAILQAVNEDVRETEHRQRLSQYQRRLDAAPQFKSLDLTTKRMIHEGPLTWKVSKDKRIEIQALLLSDCLVLLQRGPDDRLQLRYPSRWLGGGGGGGGDSKTSFSPVVKLDSLLVRSVATNNRALYVISATERQIYELVAGTPSEKNMSVPPCFLVSGRPILQKHDSRCVNVYISVLQLERRRASRHPERRVLLRTVTRLGVLPFAVETLRQLILRDLEEDGWSHDSDDTPTNETATERSALAEPTPPPPEPLEAILASSAGEWEEPEQAPPEQVPPEEAPPEEAPPEEAPPSDAELQSFQVMRKGNGVAVTQHRPQTTNGDRKQGRLNV
uniref:Rho guanine nucleotide exchange factor (GEF) 11 n=1 Tax=Salarias fasciatus TaxID=181472 RepID=A0A672II00_SALFA